MIRKIVTTSLLGLSLVAGSASAAEYKVSLDGKSPGEIHAAIEAAAVKACREAYLNNSALEFWNAQDVEACRLDAVQTAQAQADLLLARAEARTVSSGTR